MNVVIIIITLMLVLIVKWYIKYFRFIEITRKYKGPLPLPIIGNIHNLGLSAASVDRSLQLCKQYGKVYSFWISYRLRLIITDPEMIKFVLGSTVILNKGPEYKFLHSWLGSGLLTCPGSTWARQRKLLTPAFHIQILEEFVGIFNAQSDVLRDSLAKEVNRKPFDIFPYVTLCTLDVICEAAMGTQVNAQKEQTSKYVTCVKEMLELIVRRTFSLVKSVDSLFKFTSDYQYEKKILGTLHGYTNSVIQSRRKELLISIQESAKNDGHTVTKRRLALLDLLLQSRLDGEPLSDKAIQQEVDTFMFAGHDTTAAAISFALYALSKYPDIQEKVVEELRDLFGSDRTRSPTHNELQEMKYLEMVIKESLRLYPSVPVFVRQVHEECQYNGHTFPKDMILQIFALGVHMQKDIYPNPEKFDPDRFTKENSASRSPFAYIPFSAGPRTCIGQRFAMLEMKSTISTVLRNYKLLPVEDHTPQLVMDVVLKSLNGLFVRLENRSCIS